MATIAEFKRRFDKLYGSNGDGIMSLVSAEVSKTSDVIVDLNRDQLLYGRNAKGERLTPSIFDDPYFEGDRDRAYNYVMSKSRRFYEQEAMISYSKIQLFPQKDRADPNLIFSTGDMFFNHFFISVSKDSYTISSDGNAAPDIKKKYPDVFGLAPQSRNFYYFNWIRMAIMAGLKANQIGVIK